MFIILLVRKPTGVSGKGLYELKPEFYIEYSPYFYHYARTDQVKVNSLRYNYYF